MWAVDNSRQTLEFEFPTPRNIWIGNVGVAKFPRHRADAIASVVKRAHFGRVEMVVLLIPVR